MTEQEKKNKLIALFLGYEDWVEFKSVRLKRTDGIDAYIHICEYKNLKYHLLWDDLIPVLKKIDELLYASYADYDDTVQDFINKWWKTEPQTLQYTNNQLKFSTVIEDVYDEVIKFIIFYYKYQEEYQVNL